MTASHDSSTRQKFLIALRVIVVVTFLIGAFRATFFTVYRVSGSSMLKSLQDGDRIFVYDPPFTQPEVSVGDTVVLEVDGEILVKRVLAAPGDRIEMVYGHVVRNGWAVPEHIGVDRRSYDWLPETEMTEDQFFVLGDHRRVSVDSREFGPVTREQLLGVVALRAPDGGGLGLISDTQVRRPNL
ncbi:MAG: signal peptidase I [Planctomycetota bacterium]|nr:MAG: signal peptidase I [Planctomycetota bacterium]